MNVELQMLMFPKDTYPVENETSKPKIGRPAKKLIVYFSSANLIKSRHEKNTSDQAVDLRHFKGQ